MGVENAGEALAAAKVIRAGCIFVKPGVLSQPRAGSTQTRASSTPSNFAGTQGETLTQRGVWTDLGKCSVRPRRCTKLALPGWHAESWGQTVTLPCTWPGCLTPSCNRFARKRLQEDAELPTAEPCDWSLAQVLFLCVWNSN